MKAVYACLGMVAGGPLALWLGSGLVFFTSGAMIRIPANHPVNLVGQWQVLGCSYGRTMILSPAGRGRWWFENAPRPSLVWGTSGGVFYEKHVATDCWGHDRFAYKLSEDGQVLTLTSLDSPEWGQKVFQRVR